MQKEQVKTILNNLVKNKKVTGIDIIGEWTYAISIEDMLKEPEFIYDDTIVVIHEKTGIYYFELEKIAFIVATFR